MAIIYILIWIGVACFWGAICQTVDKQKNINGFWWGFWLGVFGLIVVLCLNQNNSQENKNAPTMDKFEQLERLARLKKCGAITNAEFKTEKEKLLNPTFICDNCGTEVNEEATVCPNCGAIFKD